MLINNRVIWEDDTTLRDISKNMSDVFANTTTFAYTVTDDYLYIGSELPFNHRFFDVGSTPNAVSATVSVSIWDGSAWVACVDVIDETDTGGASLAKDGIIRWTVDRDESWQSEDTTEDIPALSTLKIYNLYWARLYWSATLTAGTILNYIGHSFANDAQLGGYYPDLVSSDILTAHTSGKTSWNEQHVLAAEEIIADLKRKRMIWSANQILNPEVFSMAAIHKVAEIIMRSLGKDWEEQRQTAIKDYSVALNSLPLNIDKNEDGKLDEHERRHNIGLFRG